METWSMGPGVVELPSGRRIRGRGLRHPVPAGPRPQLGVYLLARPPQGVEWEHLWIRCRDFRSPSDRGQALSTLRHALERAGDERVEVGCGGGIGRTGVALATMAVLDGVAPADAVGWVRARYHRRAVETPWQRRWVARLPADGD